MNSKTNSREKMVAAAEKLFQIKGFNATGLNEILKESDSPKGSLYYYFPNGKEELALVAIESAGKHIHNKLSAELDKYSNPILAIQYVIKNIIEALNIEGKLEGISISLLALENYLSNESLRESCKKAFIVLEDMYAKKLIRSGFPKKVAQELGMVIEAIIEGAIIVSLTKKDTTSLLGASNQIGILLSHYI
ncbi:TetR/AcrR family transcriptional regulator [Clostridium kluyveri]|uniref:Transcriptional regulator n=2 Tax=Clostridium kluyveri TaxID=1534 RepID=A5N8Y2_CLOK5|nr:TetR/AcrR family transcriptional regulator [Clostridium kluyveri]EDK33763.1 Transcriptional regulator [Clostridium kluyveri DSM 555]BAH06647.1 hypothetical protein CKR_1596 [Clostridium kluyveri NBRC 12016]